MKLEKPMPREARPIQHPGHQGARLGHEGDPSRRGAAQGDAGVQADARRQQAGAVRAEDAQQVGIGRVQRGLLQAAPAQVARRGQAGAHHDGGAGAELAERLDDAGHGGRRRADDGQVGRRGRLATLGQARRPAMLSYFGLTGIDLALEAALPQVAQHGGAHAAGALGGADQGHRLGREQLAQVTDAHALPPAALPTLAPRELTGHNAD
jgi:hypothetical protein